ncbi:hypothetical protein SMACR_08910 [Sordaria macrospora]|uniref:WGS project CABT00000000 data, contig 2.69 n=2 Tax=Sordaria macrospora TaxID=5147 RepID=F7WB29_SORMK|nr:uncharacterized protein SMAC_08910 [Sordaria macrospora k-hell]KAA8628585.1 hypothetical protein SMACR_08910 [Sordaria macrospora]WPJ64041.1 hypothetical protein SMAC4_08910 [Sordaria macrospora]CCC14321.1 unnamed protein product [Sordaria macrospora k-hell]
MPDDQHRTHTHSRCPSFCVVCFHPILSPNMSGLEFLNVASSIISIVDAVVKVISAYQDVNGLPDAVRDAYTRLPLVADTLRLATECMNQSQPDNDQDNTTKESCRAMLQVLQACREKATLLGTIFHAVLPPGTTRPSARKRFTTAAIMTLHMGKSRKVESLMKGILQDIQLLANNRALDEATRNKIKARMDMNASAQSNIISLSGSSPPPPPVTCASPYASDEGCDLSVPSEHMQSSVPLSQHEETRPTMSYRQPSVFCSYGTGTQNIHSGRGNQNINSGQGHFFNGTVTGPIHFSTAARC